MPRKLYKPEEIIAKLRQVEILTSQGKSAVDAIRSIGASAGDLPAACSANRGGPRHARACGAARGFGAGLRPPLAHPAHLKASGRGAIV